jgi:hypothetical protein
MEMIEFNPWKALYIWKYKALAREDRELKMNTDQKSAFIFPICDYMTKDR